MIADLYLITAMKNYLDLFQSHLQPHEVSIISYFVAKGRSIELVSPPFYRKSPDIVMDGVAWEMKSPKSNGKYTIEHAFQAASKQSEHIIIDLRESKMPSQKALTKVKREAKLRTKLKRVLLITKRGRLLDIKAPKK